jgi:hypothetical protein
MSGGSAMQKYQNVQWTYSHLLMAQYYVRAPHSLFIIKTTNYMY